MSIATALSALSRQYSGHEGLDEQLLSNRKAVYEAAYAKKPERWSGSTRNWQRIEKVHLNPDKAKEGDAKDIDIQARKVA